MHPDLIYIAATIITLIIIAYVMPHKEYYTANLPITSLEGNHIMCAIYQVISEKYQCVIISDRLLCVNNIEIYYNVKENQIVVSCHKNTIKLVYKELTVNINDSEIFIKILKFIRANRQNFNRASLVYSVAIGGTIMQVILLTIWLIMYVVYNLQS